MLAFGGGDKFAMMIMVTGATGFLGVHLVKELVEAGHDVIAVDIAPLHPAGELFLEPVMARVHLVRADLGKPGDLEKAVRRPVDAVVHAAIVATSSGLEKTNPERIVGVNVVGTLEALRFARQAGARRFIYVSSSGVYGTTNPDTVLPESHLLQLTNIYPVAKYSSERIVQWFAVNEGMTAASARIAAPYGPMERNTGTRNAMSPIYRLVHAAIVGRKIALPDSGRKRDWTHAADVAQGLRLLVEHPDLEYDCYNLASGHTASLGTIADILTKLAPGFSWSEGDGDGLMAGEPMEIRGPVDIQRIRSLGFVPRFGVEDGLQDTVSWVRRLRGAGIDTHRASDARRNEGHLTMQ